MAGYIGVSITMFVCVCLFIGFVSFVAIFRLARREVNPVTFFVCLLTLWMTTALVCGIPYDVLEALEASGGASKNRPTALHVLMTSAIQPVYWVTLVFSWIVCPTLMEIEIAGEFSRCGRIKSAMRRNAAYCSFWFFFCLMSVAWMMASGHGLRGVGPWCIAASNAWGLLVSCVLLGCGLGSVPLHLWRKASPSLELQALLSSAVAMDETRLTSQFELADLISEVRSEVASRLTQVLDSKMEKAFDMLQHTVEECELVYCELTNGAGAPSRDPNQGCAVARGTEDMRRLVSLAALHRALKSGSLEARRAACRWDDLVARCIFLENLEQGVVPSMAEMVASWHGKIGQVLGRQRLVRRFCHGFVEAWRLKLRPRVLRSLSVVCGVLSIAILLGYVAMIFNAWPLSVIASAFQVDSGFTLSQVLCVVPLGYLISTAYWSFTRVKISSKHALLLDNNTDAESLLWCTAAFGRLAAPLCYHFILFIHVPPTAFQDVVGAMDMVPVIGGEPLNRVVVPILILAIVLLNIFKVYSSTVQCFGLEALELEHGNSDAAVTENLIAEGRRLLHRERSKNSEVKSVLELWNRHNSGAGMSIEEANSGNTCIPLKSQISQLIEEGTLPQQWSDA
eukprot:TRINITY_DN19457_c0_g1_i1.p1 TRINITY_DN19457_c0_g1~~TRINITY_DN19457_c0_g1_i1.p1  ORF type:complete len:623 (+),score=75.17 TRINITY_DN19457_c0_g1_i1:144-2012(+)